MCREANQTRRPQAEVGDFERAIRVQRETVSLNSNTNRVEALESQLKLYESRKPYHEPAKGP
jgi:hypothetical protein